jgi:hypothetical protein
MIASGAAELAIGRDHSETAARLIGAVEAIRQSLGIVLPPLIRAKSGTL